jgi:hypothetical protein
MLLAVALLAVPSAEGVAGRSAATRDALGALGGHGQSEARVVFILPSALPAGTVITAGGPAGPASGGKAKSPSDLKVRLAHRSWFFYEDLAPYEQYAHPGVVVLVDVKSGRARRISMIWPPVINGSLPAFLRSQAAYDSPRYRVFSGTYAPRSGGGLAGSGGGAPAFDASLAQTVAGLLAGQHACVVSLADTLPGGYYAFGRVSPTADWLDQSFSRLSALAAGFSSGAYPGGGSLSPLGFIHGRLAGGCRDVLIYLAGGGYEGGTAVNLGMELKGGSVVHQDVMLSELRTLVASRPNVHFEFVVDAPRSAGFQALASFTNVLLVATPRAPAHGSFTYLPQVLIDRRLVGNGSDPHHLLELTNSLGIGLARVLGSTAEVGQLQALSGSGQLPSSLAYLLARAFARGASADFSVQTRVALPPLLTLNGFQAPPPGRPVVTGRPDAGS